MNQKVTYSWKYNKSIRQEVTSNLSAMGSRKAPMSVIWFNLLARKPSSQSVKAAIKKRAPEAGLAHSNGKKNKKIIKGIKITLVKVSNMGRL